MCNSRKAKRVDVKLGLEKGLVSKGERRCRT
jgi:hypothetical protein